MKGLNRLPAFLFFIFLYLPSFCQERDTVIISVDTLSKAYLHAQKDSVFLASHSPRKASIYSAVLPGLGQIYNRKYWKVPIIYAGFAGLIYGVVYDNKKYNYYKDKYKMMIENDVEEWEGVTKNEAEVYKDSYKRYRDLLIIGTAGFYVLQIIDATVDAHLINYDISEDIALMIDPTILSCNGIHNTVGIKCCLSF